MKKAILLTLFALISYQVAIGQKLTFSFDSAGNQIVRTHVCVNCPSVALSEYLGSDSQNFTNERYTAVVDLSTDMRLSVDTGRQTLHLLSAQKGNESITGITLLDERGHSVLSTTFPEYNVSRSVDLSDVAPGTYVLSLSWANGLKKEVEISKL